MISDLAYRMRLQIQNKIGRGYNRLLGRESVAYPRYVAVSDPNRETIEFIRTTESRMIAEVGIFEGHTSLQLARYLGGKGELHLYDFHDRVESVGRKLLEAGFDNFQTFGCSYKMLDSYNWPLAQQIEKNKAPIYDYAFLDGAHSWAIDALAFLLIDRLLKVGGYVDFDDYNWTFDISPVLNPRTFPLTGRMYTQEQIEAEQVRMVVDLLVRRDGR